MHWCTTCENAWKWYRITTALGLGWLFPCQPQHFQPPMLRWTQSTRSSWCVGGLQLKTCVVLEGSSCHASMILNYHESSMVDITLRKTSLRWISNHMEFSQFTQSFNLVTLEFQHFYKDLTGCVKEQWKNWCCRISGTFGPKPSKYLVCFAGFDHN